MIGHRWLRPLAALALACGLAAFGGSPALAQGPPVVSAGAAPGSLSVSWQAQDGAIDYDLRYHAGSGDPADGADWIEEGEAGGPPDPGAFTSETITGLAANTTYRVQVRAETADGEGPWSASGSATTAAPPAPKIKTVHIVSWPSHDANGRGKYDTYIRGETVLVDVTFDGPVRVGGDGNVVLRLDLGEDDGNPDNSRRTATLQGVRYGDTVLRFAYTVADGDTDPDGVWVQTGANDTVLFTPGSATVTGADSGVAAERTKSGLKAAGNPKARVDGGRTSVPGPRPIGAAVNGDTLKVTFDEPLDTSVDTGAMRYALSVLGAGGIDVNQHPRAVFLSGAVLTLTLSHAARPGEEAVTLYYDGDTPLRDPDGNRAPPFRELAVTNATPGGPAPSPLRASVMGRELRLVFDRALDETSPPPGDAFVIKGHSQGTGTATVSGKTVAVRLVEAVPAAGRLRVNYTKPGETPPTYRTYPEPGGDPLRGAAADNPEVPSFYFWIETVHDGVPPALLGVEVSQTQGNPARTRAVLSFDEALDTGSVPTAGDFAVTVAGAAATISAVAVEDASVVLTLNAAAAAGTRVAVSYTPGTNPIRDRAGNAVAAFQRTLTAAESGRPVLRSATVKLSRLALTYNLPLDPGSVPAPGAFTLHQTLGSGEEAGDRTKSDYRIASIAVEGRTAVLSLEQSVFNCAVTTPFTVTYAKPDASPLQGLDGTEANGFEFRAVANDRARNCERVPTREPSLPPLTASFEGAPAAHDGQSLFSFDLVFDEDFPGRLDYRTLRDGAFVVENGRVREARRTAQGQNRRWTITVRPDSHGDVTITLPVGAVATEAGRTLAHAISATVAGPPPAVSVADAAADEGGTLAFAVTLSRAGAGTVTVDYATADGTATAGTDYTAASGTLTFAAGETAATVQVAALADAAAEATETISLVLSNPTGATIGDGEAAGTIIAVPPPLTASFLRMPAEHDGRRLFSFELRFSENFPGRLDYKVLRDRAFQVGNGRVRKAKRVAQGQNQRWTISVRPSSHELVTVTLPAGSVTTESGRTLAESVTATVAGPALLSVADAKASEGEDAAVAFPVTLSREASGEVTVQYLTLDGTAKAGEDYTHTQGTLTFAVGETEKTVSVPILDDALDEGEETFTLKLRNAKGAYIIDGEATGTIENSDPLQKMWLSRFGRTVADHVTAAVSDRLSAPLTGAQVTVGGQSMNLAEMSDEARLGETLTSIAQIMGAPSGPEPEGGPGSGPLGSGPGHAGASSWPGTGLGGSATLDSALARSISGRELLLGSAFHLAKEGDGGRPGLAAWGRVTVGGFDGEAPADDGNVRIDGEVTTGILGTDAEWDRLLAGVAVSVSEGEGTFDQPGVDSGTIESTITTVSPYARVTLNDRVSVWGLAGYGTGDMTIVQKANDRGQSERITRTDLSMRLAALGGRGMLLQADESGGFDLALKADGFHVETTSEAISGEGDTSADASRVRLALEGNRAFELGSGTFTPDLEVGLRHDGGDAETGTGVELGGRVSYADQETGLSVEAGVRALVTHEDSKYREWGASGAVRLTPGERGRGLSFSLAPTWGAPGSGVDRLWSAQDARGLAPTGGEFEPESRLEGELGYGLPLLGDRFTGTPNVGFGLTGAGARDYRIGWRLTSAVRGDPGFEVSLDATRSEPANDNGADTPAEHGVMLKGAIRF